MNKPMAKCAKYTRQQMMECVDKLGTNPLSMHPSDVRDLVWNMYIYINALEVAIMANQADEESTGRWGEGVLYEFDDNPGVWE